MLRSLGQPEIDAIVAEQGRVEVGCEFCGVKYRFDAVDAAQLFTDRADQAPGPAGVQ
jgi:molecular chaperone Hsp33